MLLKCIGISLKKNETKSYRLYSIFLLLLVVSYSCIELSEVLNNRDDFDVVTNITLHLIGFYVGISKALVLFFSSKQLKTIFDTMENASLSYNNNSFAKCIIKKCVLFSNTQAALCMTPLSFVFVATSLITILRRIFLNGNFHNLPFTQLTVIDVTNNFCYVLMWTHQTVAFMVATAAYLVAEMLITVVLIHLCVHCKILKHDIEQSIISCLAKKTQQKVLKEIVVRHMNMYQLAGEIQNTFSFVLLIVIGSDVLIIGFSAFHASLFPLTDMQCLRDVGISLSIIMKTLMVCYWGNEVRLESQTISNTCYQAHFEKTNYLFQKGLLMIMVKSQKPIIITAGKLTSVSLNTFIWIVRTSYSYFTVLQSRNLT